MREFEHRLRECHGLVFHVAYAVLRDRADAEEIVQDTFFRAYRKLSRLREPKKFRSWVARIGYRLALNRWRGTTRARRRDTVWLEATTPPMVSVETVVAQREFQHRLQQEIDRLPEKLRAVLLLSAVEELATRDVAGMLRIPEGTVRSRPDPIAENLFPPDRVLSNQKAIGLDDTQRNYVRSEVLKAQTRFTELQFQLQDAMEALVALLKQDPVDEQQVMAQLDKVLNAEREVKRTQIALMVRIKNKLKPEQQARLRQLRSKPGGE